MVFNLGLNWTTIVYETFISAALGGITVGCLFAIFYNFGPLLAFYIERQLSEHHGKLTEGWTNFASKGGNLH